MKIDFHQDGWLVIRKNVLAQKMSQIALEFASDQRGLQNLGEMGKGGKKVRTELLNRILMSSPD